VAHCCQNIELAKVMLSRAVDLILEGGLEIFPTVDINALQQEKLSLQDRVRQETMIPQQQTYQIRKPPQFITTIQFTQEEEIDVRDKIYADNIERTAMLFYQFGELPTISPGKTKTSFAYQFHVLKLSCKEQFLDVSFHVLSRLSSIWAPTTVSLDTYDDVLPKNIPYQSDIAIGSAFKDHPVLFLIFERYASLNHQFPTNDMLRSILVYFIVFWYMKEVVNVPTTLKFATQLDESTRLVCLLKPVSGKKRMYIYVYVKTNIPISRFSQVS
jgi:hypothetical protein